MGVYEPRFSSIEELEKTIVYHKALSLEPSEVVKTFFGTYAFVEHENLILLYKEENEKQ